MPFKANESGNYASLCNNNNQSISFISGNEAHRKKEKKTYKNTVVTQRDRH